MHRRDCVRVIGGTIGVLATAAAGQAQSTTLTRTIPTDRVTYVQPEDQLVFTAAADPGVEFGVADWTVDPYSDDDADGTVRPQAPLLTYTGVTGNPAAIGTFADTGWYQVTLDVGEQRLDWWVAVTEDAPAVPTVSVTSDPGPEATITVRDELTVTATAQDDNGVLTRLLWQEGRNMTYYDHTSIDGTEETVTVTVSGGDAIWFVGGYRMGAWSICEDGRAATDWTGGPDIEPFYDVTITDTNDPVDTGDDLVVEVNLAVDGHSTYHQLNEVVADLIVGHDPTHVDSTTVEVFAGDTEPATVQFATAEVNRTQTFPVRVETKDTVAETEVTVIGADERDGQGTLTVTGLETNAPVTGGEWLDVTASLENTGAAPAERTVELVVGHDPTVVDTQDVSLDAGATATVSLGYETYPVARDDEFPVTVRTTDHSARGAVVVYGRD